MSLLTLVVGVDRAFALSTAEIWKMEVKWIMSMNVHVHDIVFPSGTIISVRRGLAYYTLRAFQSFRNEEPQLSNK